MQTEEKTGILMERRINKYLISSFVIACLVMMSSCKSGLIYSDSREMKGETWNLMNVVTFDVPVEDTINSHDVIFTIRNGSAYPFRNIWLFVSATSPDGNTLTDTLNYNLADEKGNWYGRGFGDINELNLPYKSNVYFPHKGTYKFAIQHGMRAEDLKGIYDIGLRIQRTGK
jgi:gliding motility-associated lipoprotein GldH